MCKILILTYSQSEEQCEAPHLTPCQRGPKNRLPESKFPSPTQNFVKKPWGVFINILVGVGGQIKEGINFFLGFKKGGIKEN